MSSYTERRAHRMGYNLGHWKGQLLKMRLSVMFASQRELADRLGVHRMTIKAWEETGTFPHRPHLDRLEKLGKEVAGWTRRDWAQPKEAANE